MRQIFRRTVPTGNRPRNLPDEPAGSVLRADSERGFNPGGQRVHAVGLVGFRCRGVDVNNLAKCLDYPLTPKIDLRCCTLQRLSDDLRHIEWNSKERLGDFRHFTFLFLRQVQDVI